jgi:hypothetical protein
LLQISDTARIKRTHIPAHISAEINPPFPLYFTVKKEDIAPESESEAIAAIPTVESGSFVKEIIKASKRDIIKKLNTDKEVPRRTALDLLFSFVPK